MTLSIIVAMSVNRVIGKDNRLPWRLPADLARFKRLTMGHHLLLGRKTFESIGRPLPGREMLVITRQEGYAADGVQVVHSIDEAIEVARTAGEQEAFIAGGAEIYRQTLSRADRVYLTLVRAEYDGDARFPEIDESAWRLVRQEDRGADESNRHPVSFLLYEADRRARR